MPPRCKCNRLASRSCRAGLHIPFGKATIDIVVKDPSSEWHLRLCGAMKVAAIGLEGGLPQLMHEEWFLEAATKDAVCPVAQEHLKDMLQARNCARELLQSQQLGCFADIGRVLALVACGAWSLHVHWALSFSLCWAFRFVWVCCLHC